MGKEIVAVAVAVLSLSLLVSLPTQEPLRTPDHTATISRLLERGDSLSVQGNFIEAYRILIEAREAARNSGLSGEEAACLFRLGRLAWNLSQIAEASNHFRAGLALAKDQPDVDLRGRLAGAYRIVDLYNLGKSLRSRSLLKDSVRSFDEAIRLSKEIETTDFEPKCLRQKSLTLWQSDDLLAYLSCNERAASIARGLRNAAEEGKCLNNIGVYYEKICAYSKAMSFFEHALEVAQSGQDLPTAAECFTNLGVVYLRLNDFARAEAYFGRAVGIDESLKSGRSVAMDLNNLGVAVLKRASLAGKAAENESLTQARAYFDSSRVLLMSDDDPYTRLLVENNLGYIHYLKREYAKAAWRFGRCMTLANELQNSYMQSTVSINLARVRLDQGLVSDAIDHLNRGIHYGSRAGAGDLLWEALFGLGECYEREDNKPKALLFYESAIAAVEKTRRQIASDPFRIGFVRNKSEIFARAVDLLAAQYNERPSSDLLSHIFALIERAKSQALLDSLADAGPVASPGLNPSIKEREERSSKKISALFVRLSDTQIMPGEREDLKAELDWEEAEYQRILADMRLANRGLAEMIVPSICDLRDVQSRLLDSHTALLEYFLGKKRSYRILVTDQRVDLQELPARGAIEDSLRGFLKVLSSPPTMFAFNPRAASRIAKDLLPQESLANLRVDSLLVVPDGILYYLPFESLMTLDGPEGLPSFLAEHYCISYGPSASVFIFLKRPLDWSNPAKRFLAVADPKSPPPLFTVVQPQRGSPRPLSFGRREALDFSRIFNSSRSDVLVGEDANETKLKNMPLDVYSVIHFACHGLVDIEHPYRSAVVLSRKSDGNDDGYLQAREIYGLHTRADLVVLSACETAIGPLESPEGLMGLPRAFFCAGARSVLSSLWPVYDKATADFMKDFYRAVANGKDVGQALRSAKQRIIHSPLSHPFYWAGFVLAGPPCPLPVYPVVQR